MKVLLLRAVFVFLTVVLSVSLMSAHGIIRNTSTIESQHGSTVQSQKESTTQSREESSTTMALETTSSADVAVTTTPMIEPSASIALPTTILTMINSSVDASQAITSVNARQSITMTSSVLYSTTISNPSSANSSRSSLGGCAVGILILLTISLI